jgi:hypothetical protein
MDRTAPEKKPGPKGKADQIRDQLLAADLEMVSAWAEALVRTVEAQRAPSSDEEALQRLRNDLEIRTQAAETAGRFLHRGQESDLPGFRGRIVYPPRERVDSRCALRAGVQQEPPLHGVDSASGMLGMS